MSTPRPSAPDQPTRQQLDELDALLERMLSMPEKAEPEEAGPPVTTLVSEPPAMRAPRVGTREQAPVFVATVTTDVKPPSIPAPPPVVERSAEPVRRWVPASTPLDQIIDGPLAAARQEAVEAVIRESARETASKELVAPENAGPVSAKRDEEAPPSSEKHPLRSFNADRTGTVSRLGPTGRNVLGWSGLFFLALAVALVVLDRIGWTW